MGFFSLKKALGENVLNKGVKHDEYYENDLSWFGKYSNEIFKRYNPKTLKLKKKKEHFKLSIKPLVY